MNHPIIFLSEIPILLVSRKILTSSIQATKKTIRAVTKLPNYTTRHPHSNTTRWYIFDNHGARTYHDIIPNCNTRTYSNIASAPHTPTYFNRLKVWTKSNCIMRSCIYTQTVRSKKTITNFNYGIGVNTRTTPYTHIFTQ